MHVTFLLGPAGSGKTFRCLAEVRAALASAPDGPPLVFLAPKQATFGLERELLADPELPGYTRLQILSFERLAEFVLNQFSSTPPRILNKEGRVMVLRALLSRHHAHLKIFAASARRPGLAQELSKLLNELQQHQLSPEQLIKFSDESRPGTHLKDKLHDLAFLLRVYLDWLEQNQLQDPNGRLELAAGAVKAARNQSNFQIEGLWLDGFADMSPQELDLLAALIPSCERVTLAFCLDGEPVQGDEWHSMWATISRSFYRCYQRLEVLPGFQSTTHALDRHPINNRFAASPALAHLERFWVLPRPLTPEIPEVPNASTPTDHEPVQVFTCPDPETEAVVAARAILKHVREGVGRFRDVAVMVRSLDDYERVLCRVFTRYGIRFFVDRRERVSHHPLAELTRYALRVVVSNWEHADWFGALKTGLAHPDQEAIDRLENEALARGWRGPVWLHPLSQEPEDKGFEQFRSQVVPPFSRFADRLVLVQRQPTGEELAGALRALWEELGVAETLQDWSQAAASAKGDSRDFIVQSEIHLQTWAEMESWLDNLELAFGTTRLPLADWIPVVEAGLANLSAGLIPPALDEVLIGQVDRSRNPNLEMMILLGLNETVFPAPSPPPVLLSYHDRETLQGRGLTLSLGEREQLGHERLLGYMACTRARKRLVLTYADRDRKGKALNPSPFINHLQRLFPGLEPKQGGPCDWRQSLHPHELVVPLLQNRAHHLGSPMSRNQSLAALGTLPLFAPVIARWDQIAKARSVTRLSQGLANRIYGTELKTSISNLEDYAACPFKFFLARGLCAEERKEFEVDSRERGSFQHEILMEFHRHLQSEGKRWRDLTKAGARELLGEIGRSLQQTFRQGLFSSAPERCFTARTLIESLQNFIEVLAGWAPQYLFEPQAVEISFGMEEGLKGWRIDLGNGHHLLLRGRIDRVDLQRQPNGEAYAVVIDYKSSGQELEQVKLINGLDLQLLAYLGVLRDASNAAEMFGPSKLVPGGAFYVSLRSHGGAGRNRIEVLQETEARRQSGYQHRGRFRADLLHAFDNRQGAKGDQFRYALKKDGAFSKKGNEALSEREFLGLVDQIKEFLRQYAQEIYEGNVRIEPYRHKSHKACDYCDYLSVCRFDPWVDPYRALKSEVADDHTH